MNHLLIVAALSVGGVVGNAAEHMGTRDDAVEILVQLPNGEGRAIAQARGSKSSSSPVSR